MQDRIGSEMLSASYDERVDRSSLLATVSADKWSSNPLGEQDSAYRLAQKIILIEKWSMAR